MINGAADHWGLGISETALLSLNSWYVKNTIVLDMSTFFTCLVGSYTCHGQPANRIHQNMCNKCMPHTSNWALIKMLMCIWRKYSIKEIYHEMFQRQAHVIQGDTETDISIISSYYSSWWPGERSQGINMNGTNLIFQEYLCEACRGLTADQSKWKHLFLLIAEEKQIASKFVFLTWGNGLCSWLDIYRVLMAINWFIKQTIMTVPQFSVEIQS